jgi:hypothetical protein
VPRGAKDRGVEDAGKAQESSHGMSPQVEQDAVKPSTG